MCKNIGIIGLGFVGSSCDAGFSLIPDLEIFGHDKYKDSYALNTVVEECKLLFICLPTPMNFETGKCDTSIIEGVCKNINKLTKTRKIIVIKSTVPPGTTQRLADKYSNHSWLFNPEFLTEANAINDFINQDRIILGRTSQCRGEDLAYLISFYQKFTKTQFTPAIIFASKSEEAEMCKYIGNCFLATKVTFFNEIWQICKEAGINYENASGLAKLDTRIGTSHMKVPNGGQFGFGGSCFVKDLNSLMFFAKSLGVDPLVMESVWTKNLLVREDREWERLPQVSGRYEKK